MLRRTLRHAYARLGSRYPPLALGLLFAAGHLVGLGGIGLLRLYQDMTTGQLVALALAVVALVLVENALGLLVVRRLLRPAQPWLHGDRSGPAARAAWQALAGLPLSFVQSGRWLAAVINVVPISVLVVVLLDLDALSFLVVMAGAAVVVLYGTLLRFFGTELVLRPVLEAASRDVPDGSDLGGERVPLRWKLLIALPAINVVTGVVVASLSAAPDGQTLDDLGWDVLVALAVAFTLSFELTLLLARSVTDQVVALRLATERAGTGDLSARAPVLSTDEVGALAGRFNRMLSGLQERERLREAFGAFVDPQVVDRVLEEGTVLEGEEVEVSVLFLDIRGFTALAERSTAREVVARLNDFYGTVVPVLVRHGGHANKFVGDGLLGVFGAPLRVDDHADRAVFAALDIARTVRERYGDALRIGIGVNSGPVLAGTVGGGGHVEFTVIGDAVNTAARVEEVTRVTGDDVLLTERTHALLTFPFGGFVERPTVALKGKSERVRLYAPRQAAAVVASGHVD
jgi:adenylate cyclase